MISYLYKRGHLIFSGKIAMTVLDRRIAKSNIAKIAFCGALAAMTSLAACAPDRSVRTAEVTPSYTGNYILGPGDSLEVFVWHNPELSVKVPVRPDGRISIPLAEDIDCSGKTPTQLARTIETRLKAFVNDPVVTVIVNDFNGPYSQQVRVVGEASKPHSISYRQDMTVLDAMIAVGGLTPYAAGNRAVLVRSADGKQQSVPLHLDDLLKDGDIRANVALRPGDVLIIPESYF